MVDGWKFLIGLLALIAYLAIGGLIVFYVLKKSDDPARVAFKLILTLLALPALIYIAQMGPFAPIFGGAVGLVLAILWAPHIGAVVAKPFVSLYEGSDEKAEARPMYSIAQAKYGRGDYPGAVAELDKQLQRFPTDYFAQRLKAQILTEQLLQPTQGRAVLETIIEEQEHSPANVCDALNVLTDWALNLDKDVEAARGYLDRIIARYPDSTFANSAHQRVARLGSFAAHHDARTRGPISMVDRTTLSQEMLEGDVTALHLAQLRTQVERYPMDIDSREELALLLGRDLRQPDEGVAELELLISLPNRSAKEIARWINQIADIYVANNDPDRARTALERIIETNPGNAAGEVAATRIQYLGVENRTGITRPTIALKSYGRDLGLKRADETRDATS